MGRDMLVTCDNCRTGFNLDADMVSPEGTWVRCTKCQDVFQVFPPGQAAPADEHMLDLGQAPTSDQPAPGADFGLEPPEGDHAGHDSGLGRYFKIIFWSLASLLLLAVVLVGTLVAMDRLGLATGLVDRARSLPGLGMLLTPAGMEKPTAAKVVDTSGLSLTQVRGYFRVNQQAGRIFVIQGLVENQHPQSRAGVLIRGKLNDDKGTAVRQAVIYAGAVFTPDELRSMSVADMQARLGQPANPQGERYIMGPQGGLPFMLVFSNLPDNLSHFTAEVVGSETLPAGQKP
jgi:predicted Zn finger-like uncharacterized protein